MLLSDVSIRRPIFTLMIISALVVFGLVSYSGIGIDMMPNVEFPLATVTTIYPGADPATMEKEVSDKIEEVVSTLNGVRTLKSISADSVSQVIVMFELEVKADQAVQDVRDKVNRILPNLPKDAETPKVEKFDMGSMPILTLAVSGNGSIDEITRFARKQIKESIQQIPGVGSVDIIGGQEREVQVFVDPRKLDAVGMTVIDVAGVLMASNLQYPGGRLKSDEIEFTVKVDNEYKDVRSVEEQVIMESHGRRIKIGDVARVEDGLEERRSMARLNGDRAVSLIVRKQSGTNTVEVADRVKARLDELRPSFPPGWDVLVATDNTLFTKTSIEHVQFDMIFGAVLAVLIIFLFLRNTRSTLISALAIPTSVIGTFIFIKIMGFTFNTISLLGLSLSIGILIDDAIVVIENIYRHMEAGKSAWEAAGFATGEIGLAVLATTMSIVAVFVPVAFMEGIVGRFMYQFGVTVTVAVLISLFVSFTLTPMLSSRVLAHGGDNAFFRFLERRLDALDRGYRRLIAAALRFRFVTMITAIGVFIVSLYMARFVPMEFQTAFDMGEFNVSLTFPTGTTIEETDRVSEEIAHRIRKHADLVHSTVTTIGSDAQQKQNFARVYTKLVPKDQRSVSQKDFMAVLREELSDVEDVRIALEDVDAMADSGGFRSAQIQLGLRGGDLEELDKYAQKLKNELGKIPGFVDLDTSFEKGKPEVQVRLDRERAARAGVMTADVGQTVYALVGGMEASKFKVDGENYNIRVRLDVPDRRSPDQIGSLKVRNGSGQLVELRNVAHIETGSGPTQIDRQSRQRQIVIYGNLDSSLALGDAVEIMKAKAEEILPPTITPDLEGEARFMRESFMNMFFSLFLAIILVYMVLASQFESLIHPLTIMFSLPLSLVGALGGLLLTGDSLSIISMIGIIMLMGLVTKNAILLVDYTNTLRHRDGMSREEALLTAGPTRLRPILMTTAAMVFGMLPVAMSNGFGSEMRSPMAVCVIGGLLASTLLTLLVVPVVYTLMDDLSENRVTKWILRKAMSHEAPKEGTHPTAT